jgi:hypothetical protein
VPGARAEALAGAVRHLWSKDLFWFHGKCSGDELIDHCYRERALTSDTLASLLALAFDVERSLMEVVERLSAEWFGALEARAAGDNKAIALRFSARFRASLEKARACSHLRRRLDRLMLGISKNMVAMIELSLPGQGDVLSSFLYLAMAPLSPAFRRLLEHLDDSVVFPGKSLDYPCDAAINLDANPHSPPSHSNVLIFRELFQNNAGFLIGESII